EPGAAPRIDQRLPQHVLGELVGATRESVNKQMRQWVTQGAIRLEGRYLILVNPAGLASTAGTSILQRSGWILSSRARRRRSASTRIESSVDTVRSRSVAASFSASASCA